MNITLKNFRHTLFNLLRFAGLVAVIGVGLVSITGTGGGHGGSPTYYLDADGDGYGDAAVFLKQDTRPEGYVSNGSDCDDTDAAIHPGAVETPADGIDQDCNGFDLKTWYPDADGDGYGKPDGSVEADTAPAGYVADGNDCDDRDAGVFPGNTEIVNDGIDQDCDGFDLYPWYRDTDGDGFGDPDIPAVEQPPFGGYVDNHKDCNDTDAAIYAGAPEIPDDGIDQDCDGGDLRSWYPDADGDGYGDPGIVITANSAPQGYVANNEDCDDENPDIFPGACDPPQIFLTVDNIPASMNGSVPYLDNNGQMVDFTLAVPSSGSLWNITVDCPCGCRTDGLQVWTDPPLPSGADPTDLFESDGNGRFSWLVDETNAFYQTAVLTVNATITDKCGQESDIAALTVRTVDTRSLLTPFDLQDPWLFVYKRDFYTITNSRLADGSREVNSEAVANDVPDFIEDLWSLGLGTPTPAPAFETVTCAGGENGNDCLARMVLERTREKTYRLFNCQPDGTRGTDGVNIRLWIEGESGAPDPEDFAYQTLNGREIEKSFSMMGFGGGDLGNPGVGLPEHLDYRNVLNEDNTQKDFGILTTSLDRYVYEFLNNNAVLDLLATINLGDVLVPAGGTPIGTFEDDARVIDLSVPAADLSKRSRSRREQMLMLMNRLTDGLSALTAHEIGHSVGLVPPGPPPYGFFAGETQAAFIEDPDGSTEAHIDTAGFNLMQDGPETGYISEALIETITDSLFEEADNGQIFFFNEISMAYMQGRLLLLP